MDFNVVNAAPDVQSREPTRHAEAFLVFDGWDDYGYKTLHKLIIFDKDGGQHDIGGVKIGQKDFGRSGYLPSSFTNLDETFFSLGQKENYYANLNSLGVETRNKVLQALRDVAADLRLFDKMKNEPSLTESLLRSVDASFVRGRLHRLAFGNEELTPYSFAYIFPRPESGDSHELLNSVDEPPITSMEFLVTPNSLPPTNIHVLIGRNGVGKTRCLNLMARSIVEQKPDTETLGTFTFAPVDIVSEAAGATFANVVAVSFSAFDSQGPLRSTKDKPHGIPYSYIGLWSKQGSSKLESRLRDFKQLSLDFYESVNNCLNDSRKHAWLNALENLDSDPLFKEANVSSLSESAPWDLQDEAKELFDNLSSGHKIVLLTITRLVEDVNEQTLVLLDEPEGHLHPPLLAAFIRTLSLLLMERNGVAIIATHSPVVLQEVPSSCVWVLHRSGSIVQTHRTETETFGGSVGTLTRAIFGLEVTDSGFHRLLREATDDGSSYKSVVKRFGNNLGAEAQAILRALIAVRDAGQQTDEEL